MYKYSASSHMQKPRFHLI